MNTFYANAMNIGVTAYDAVLQFHHNDLAAPPSIALGETLTVNPTTIDTINVVMSLQHLKAMLPSLVDAVRQYETNVGRIPIEQNAQTRFDALGGQAAK